MDEEGLMRGWGYPLEAVRYLGVGLRFGLSALLALLVFVIPSLFAVVSFDFGATPTLTWILGFASITIFVGTIAAQSGTVRRWIGAGHWPEDP